MARTEREVAERIMAMLGSISPSLTDEISCPYCTKWNSVTIRADEGEEKEVTCIGCSGVFNVQLVQYLVAMEI